MMGQATSAHSSARMGDRRASRSTGPPPRLRRRDGSRTEADRDGTIATYDRLAAEYDQVAHETTRGLEIASVESLSKALRLVARRTHILELGCGTGVATEALSSVAGVRRIVATDPSQRMLEQAAIRLGNIRPSLISWVNATAATALSHYSDVNLVVASLADPYLDGNIVQQLVTHLDQGAHAFFSVPSRRWANVERGTRLAISLDLTRFRLSDGSALYARSTTFEPDELENLFTTNGLEIVGSGFVSGSNIRGRPRPEVSWALVRRSVLEDP